MPRISELPAATLVADDDLIPASQAGTTRVVRRGQLVAGLKADQVSAQGALLGRASQGPGPIEELTLGLGLALQGGQLVVDPVAGGFAPVAPSATATSFAPTGSVQASNVQAAIAELDAEKASLGHGHAAADTTSGVFATARLGNGAATATTFLRGDQSWASLPPVTAAATGVVPGGTIAATNVQGAILELDAEKAALVHSHGAEAITSGQFTAERLGTGSAGPGVWLRGDLTWASLPAATATATAFAPTPSLLSTNVQAAIAELDQAKAPATHGHAASAITSGHMAPERLAGGTATATTWLRGDQTWASLPAATASATAFAPAGNVAATTVQAAIAELDAEKAALVHSHAASAVTSGTFAIDRLGSGTANAGVFLRGDQTWAAVPAPSAGAIAFTASGSIAAANVQAAIVELDLEKAPLTHVHAASAITSGTFTTDRLGSGTASSAVFLRGDQTWASVPAPTATAVGFTPSGNIAATTVQAALAELDVEKAAVGHTHATSSITSGVFTADRLGAGSANAGVFLRGDLTWTALPPATATATSFTPAGALAATNVQAALAELDTEKAAAVHGHVLAEIGGLQAVLDAKRNDAVSAPGRLLGRSSAGAGPTEELTVGSGLTLAGGTLTADAATGVLPLSDITTGGYIAGAADWFRRRRYSGSAAINVTITGDPGPGVVAAWVQWGAGKVTLLSSGGHTLRPAFGTTLTETTGQYSMILLERISATESIVYGGPLEQADIADIAGLGRELDRRAALGPATAIAGRWLGAIGNHVDLATSASNVLRLHLMPLWVPAGVIKSAAFRVQVAFGGGTLPARAVLGLYAMNQDGSPGALVNEIGVVTSGLNTTGTKTITGLSIAHPTASERFLGLMIDRQDNTAGTLLANGAGPQWFQSRVGRLNADGAFSLGANATANAWIGGAATWTGAAPGNVAATPSLVGNAFASAIQVDPS